VFWGCEYISSTTGKKTWSNYWPGSGANSLYPVRAFVYDNPLQTFVIATSNVNTSWDTEAELRAAVFANANFAGAQSGSTITGISSATLDVQTIADTNTLNLRIMGIQEDPENSDFSVAGIPVIVRLNNHWNPASMPSSAWSTLGTRTSMRKSTPPNPRIVHSRKRLCSPGSVPHP
jgi:hypothetical protein